VPLEDELQLGLQAPFEDLLVSRRQQEAGAVELGRGADKGHQITVGLCGAMAKKAIPAVLPVMCP
jgi:hypothetical protein